MGNIHINTDYMRQLGGSLSYWSNYLRDGMIPAVRHLTSQLETDWYGISRQRYDALIQDLETQIFVLISRTEEVSQHLVNTANEFDTADNS